MVGEMEHQPLIGDSEEVSCSRATVRFECYIRLPIDQSTPAPRFQTKTQAVPSQRSTLAVAAVLAVSGAAAFVIKAKGGSSNDILETELWVSGYTYGDDKIAADSLYNR